MAELAVHHHPEPHGSVKTPDPHQDTLSTHVLGFWMYLMTDCILFATLFTTYAVLYDTTLSTVFNLTTAFTETLLLLTSTLTCGLAVITKRRQLFLALTFILGAAFVALELHEFYHLIQEGYSWTKSAYLSAFFTLVGTHGLHVVCGLLWLIVLMTETFNLRHLLLFSFFWHFLDVVWIFIFTYVYLWGVSP